MGFYCLDVVADFLFDLVFFHLGGEDGVEELFELDVLGGDLLVDADQGVGVAGALFEDPLARGGVLLLQVFQVLQVLQDALVHYQRVVL